MYVYLAALQTPVLPPKPQKDAYFFWVTRKISVNFLEWSKAQVINTSANKPKMKKK